jgi:hypothetical protein
MSIHNNGGLAVNVANYKICRLPADAGRVLNPQYIGHLAAEIRKNFLRHTDDGFRLCAVKPQECM